MHDPQLAKRLSAILVADVAGYARLMEADEAATYSAWRSARTEAIEPAVAQHGGRIVKFTGDGLLAEFPTAESALGSAVDIQKGCVGRDPLKLRIGIHLGDVVLEEGDIYGDGVNIAARLETLAEPGGICISGTVHDLVRRKLGFAFSDGGDSQLKHIDQPVRIWRAGPEVLTEPAKPAVAAEAPRRPGIAVLPFANMSGDAEQEYFADGLAEDLITELSRTGALFVIARNSTFVYKGRAVSITDIARELRVRYVLEGSVRKAGARVRVTAQLIDGGSGGHLWAERYDRDLTDIFAVQDEITASITRALALNLSANANERVAGTGTSNVEAYDLFLKARDLAWRLTKATNEEARALVERAIALDPGFARGHALLGHIHLTTWLNRWGPDTAEHERLALELGQTAMGLNAFDPFGYWVVASVHLWHKQFEVALTMTQRAHALDPGFTPIYATMGGALLGLGRAGEALEAFEIMHRADPHSPPIVLHFRARALFVLDRLAEAAALLEERIARNPETDVSRALLTSVYGHLGRFDEARSAWAGLFKTNPDYSLARRKDMLSAHEYEKLAAGIAKAGLTDVGTPSDGRHASI